jgi:hypothetical protein
MQLDRRQETAATKRPPEDDIGEHLKDTAMMAARARRGADLQRKEAELRAMHEKQQIHHESGQRSKAAEDAARAKEMAMRGEHAHEVEVLRGAVARGRAASHAASPNYAPTVAYPAKRSESLASTAAYPAHRSRSRHIPLPTDENAEAMEEEPKPAMRRHSKKSK